MQSAFIVCNNCNAKYEVACSKQILHVVHKASIEHLDHGQFQFKHEGKKSVKVVSCYLGLRNLIW